MLRHPFLYFTSLSRLDWGNKELKYLYIYGTTINKILIREINKQMEEKCGKLDY
jgi:hypothetical protein